MECYKAIDDYPQKNIFKPYEFSDLKHSVMQKCKKAKYRSFLPFHFQEPSCVNSWGCVPDF